MSQEVKRWLTTLPRAGTGVEALQDDYCSFIEAVSASDHDRIVAELKAEADHLNRQLADAMSGCCDCPMFKAQGKTVAELRAENDILKSKASQFESTLKETMRVRDAEIEKLKKEDAAMVQRLHAQSKIMANLESENERLKSALVDIANKNTCWRLYEIDKYKSYEDGWEGVAEFAAKVLKELEAIGKGEE